MTPYKNTAGNSGVIAYETAPGRITVRFADGTDYLYTNSSAGVHNIHHMHQLARVGRGLSTFISTTVKDKYERRINH